MTLVCTTYGPGRTAVPRRSPQMDKVMLATTQPQAVSYPRFHLDHLILIMVPMAMVPVTSQLVSGSLRNAGNFAHPAQQAEVVARAFLRLDHR